jgi:hypothetical protein
VNVLLIVAAYRDRVDFCWMERLFVVVPMDDGTIGLANEDAHQLTPGEEAWSKVPVVHDQ